MHFRLVYKKYRLFQLMGQVISAYNIVDILLSIFIEYLVLSIKKVPGLNQSYLQKKTVYHWHWNLWLIYNLNDCSRCNS